MSILDVNDQSANLPEMIVRWGEYLGRSKARNKVFDQVNLGKRAVWSVAEIVVNTGLSAKQVLDEGKRLVNAQLIIQEKGFPVRYRKRNVVQSNKKKIKRAAMSKANRDQIATKQNPRISVKVSASGRAQTPGRARYIAPVKISQFSKMGAISAAQVKKSKNLNPLSEEAFKASIVEIIGEPYQLKDWGGEQLDIFSTRPTLLGSRRPTGFALKGPGSASGILTPAKMGKNGDQIQRLIDDSVEVAVVQYEGPVGQSIYNLLARLGGYKAHQTGSDFFYSVIDKEDSIKLRLAYPSQFRRGWAKALAKQNAKRKKAPRRKP